MKSDIFRKNMPKLLVAPSIVIILLITIFPMLWSLYSSLHSVYLLPGRWAFTWVGASNYIWIFTSRRFWLSVLRMTYYGVLGVTIQVGLGTTLALLLHYLVKESKIKIILLMILISPMAFAPIVAGNIWRLLLSPTFGVADAFCDFLRLPRQRWFGSQLALTSVIVADIWQWTSLPLLVIFAGRMSLSDRMYEAAKIDGASNWFILRKITLPLLRNLMVVAFLLRWMDMYKFFDKLYLMTKGGPGTSSEITTFFTYLTAFQNMRIGRAAALSWVIVMGVILSSFLFWEMYKRYGL